MDLTSNAWCASPGSLSLLQQQARRYFRKTSYSSAFYIHICMLVTRRIHHRHIDTLFGIDQASSAIKATGWNNADEPTSKRRLATAPHSVDWLHAVPVFSCGLKIGDVAVRIVVASNFALTVVQHTNALGARWSTFLSTTAFPVGLDLEEPHATTC